MSDILHYIGTKTIRAKRMTRQEYNDLRNWQLPADECGDDPGYLVEYVDGGQSNHPDFAGYISWSPSDVFERSYRAFEGHGQKLTFGDALEMLKQGKKVARAGWNGKDMWLSMSGNKGGSIVSYEDFWSTNNAEFAYSQPDQCAVVLPAITMKTADNKILMGWLASQTDMLAEDWQVIE